MKLSRPGRTGCPVVALTAFIDAIRDSGYRTPAHALAELVDNSLEADATHISIIIRTDGPSGGQTIRVVDDGCGMSPSTLQQALQFGGSTRFSARTGTGRYGMGLPCSALSQARRVDVCSWRSPWKTWWTYLDARAVANGTLVHVPTPKAVSGIPGGTKSGTVVVLSDCDRFDLRSPTATNSMKQTLGRIFRRAILRGAAVSLNDEPVRPVDPLFRDATHAVVRSQSYGPLLDFPVRTPGGATSIVRVRFTELPVEKLCGLSNAEKAEAGITKGAGVSVVRAGREIDYGWFFMGPKRKENYDDWWRCEVEFEPVLDELFGLTHTKQRIHPTPPLVALLAPHMESIARLLNRRVREAFQRIASLRKDSIAGRRAESRDAQLEPPSAVRRSPNSKSRLLSGIAGLRYKTCRSSLPNGEFFKAHLAGKVLTMTINIDHAFHEQLLEPFLQHRVVPAADAVAGIELLLLAYCRAETSLQKGGRRIAQRLRREWGDVLSAYFG
jgi:Histidine kinase-, DNA gyrase B-, and HSP90-like ATPase